MRPRFVHLGINPVGAVANLPTPSWPENFRARLEYVLSTHALDWYRYGSQTYVLYSSIDLAELGRLIAQMPGFQNVYVLLTEMPDIEPNASNGWMPQQFWNWLYTPR